jgi:hypothetical protein
MEELVDKLITQHLSLDVDLNSFLIKVNHCIKNLKEEMRIGFEKRESSFLSIESRQYSVSDESFEKIFFRTEKRIDVLKKVLLYLVSFAQNYSQEDELYDKSHISFIEFKNLVLFLIDLLLEEDVQKSIAKEYEKLSTENKKQVKDMILQNHKEFVKLLKNIEASKDENYTKLFNTLKNLSTFWFKIKSWNSLKIRKTDIFMYQLTEILLSKKEE